ncbi:laccase [Fomitiporia mediterranea MF3/22]|uniref:laccase n=1 Tax=Fomitiporia mediterranea (strain MF3/22) TaxID=694068 RepID=UPI000440775A|nr:laccase [Fomitiporia mediterranea MF3/22]EJD07349.1 laccase [Fomitiporia mediterranea MF3/22]
MRSLSFQLGALTFVAFRSLLGGVFAADVNFSLNITNAVVAPDGFSRSVVTANGKIPSPLIYGNVGDRFLINVTDSLTDPTMIRSTSIHWHGILQKNGHSASMDGAASVTQCPIVPGHSYTYNFSCPVQSGTYWYHSHLSTQYCDGLSGPLVIYDPEDPLKFLYDVDDESTVISLSDWYHTPAPQLNGLPGPPPVPDSTLINGLGRWNINPTSELAVIRAQPGKRHRFRVVNMSCHPSYNFSISGHKMIVIEADGVETDPVMVDSLEIFAGQRYSIVVIMDKPVGNYWIRAIPSYPNNATTDNGVNSAILRYEGASATEPSKDFEPQYPVVLKETDLHPLREPGAPGEPYPGGADVVLTLKPSFKSGSWAVNNATFTPPSIPVLLQVLSGASSAQDLLPAGSVYTLPPNKVIEVTVQGINDHPFHLHGHTFDVIQTAGSSEYNFVNPVRRDVVTPGQITDNITIRFVTDNPGPWFFHCHIDWHLEHGLAVVFAEDVDGMRSDDVPGDSWKDLCPLYDQLNPDKHLR